MPAAAARTRRGERVGEEAAAVRRWRRRRVESIGVGGRVRGRGKWEKTGAEAAGDMWTQLLGSSRATVSLGRFVLIMFLTEKKMGEFEKGF